MNEDTEFDDKAHKSFAYFLDAEEELLHSEADVDKADQALDTWLVKLFNILDYCLLKNSAHYDNNAIVLAASSSYPGPDTYGFLPFSLPDLPVIMDVLTFFSFELPEQHLLLNIGAPQSICSKE